MHRLSAMASLDGKIATPLCAETLSWGGSARVCSSVARNQHLLGFFLSIGRLAKPPFATLQVARSISMPSLFHTSGTSRSARLCNSSHVWLLAVLQNHERWQKSFLRLIQTLPLCPTWMPPVAVTRFVCQGVRAILGA
jgi:hypothetical protein